MAIATADLDSPDTISLHDLTNIHDTGRHNDGLRRFGRPKQKCNDGLLVTLAPMLDSAGFPRCCEILPGNLSEPETLETGRRRR